MNITLKMFPYKYMEYEKELMKREINKMFPGAKTISTEASISLENFNEEYTPALDKLTYVMSYKHNGGCHLTLQAKLELCSENGNHSKRQRTRYSTNGLHEYKGKFNPQIVHSIINILGINNEMTVLDPFCGSGTTLLECQHMGIYSIGIDINPLAVYIANTKITSLGIDVSHANRVLERICNVAERTNAFECESIDSRISYLKKWIPLDVLAKIERIKDSLIMEEAAIANFFMLLVSDLIRDYSNQEPSDLRIRKRFSSFPDKGFVDVLYSNALKLLNQISKIQETIGCRNILNYAINSDFRRNVPSLNGRVFDAAITSPPYVTALPYIDTQRLSLVWLNLSVPKHIAKLESSLIGSRDMVKKEMKQWVYAMQNNGENLPQVIYELIVSMKKSLSKTDGFRKQAMPYLLYRYFTHMKRTFMNLRSIIRPNGHYAMVVGHNKTTLGDKTFRIDTPHLLGVIAKSCEWVIEEEMPLQTYKRYGLNSKNAINCETLLILRNSRG